MLFALSIFFIFVITFILLVGTYLLLVFSNILKKKKIEKVFRFILVYSVFITFVFVFQYFFI